MLLPSNSLQHLPRIHSFLMMQISSRIFLLGYLILLLENFYGCFHDEKTTYIVQLVKDIKETIPSNLPLTSMIDESSYIGETCFSQTERLNLCEEAAKIVNKINGLLNVTVSRNFSSDIMKWYALDMESEKQPDIVQAFECPTEPTIYLNVHYENRKQFVNIIVRRSDIILSEKPYSVCVEDMCYAMKQVKEILPADPDLVSDLQLGEGVTAFNTDQWSEELRLQVCRRALTEVEYLARKNVTLIPEGKTDKNQLYVVQSDDIFSYTIAQAYRCPTKPPIYLEVVQIGDEFNRTYYVWVIAETAQFTTYVYQTKVIQEITASKKSAQNASQFTEQHRVYVCGEAAEKLRAEGRYVEFLEGVIPEKSQYYRVRFKTGIQRDTLAFRCPTNPPLYLSLDDQGNLGVMLVLIVETEPVFPRLNIIAFKMKFVDEISEVSKENIPSNSVKYSSVRFEDLTHNEYEEICRKAIKMMPKIRVTFLAENEREQTKYYAIVMDSEDQSAEPVHVVVQALKCPTSPEIYLYVESAGENEGNIAWICVTETAKSAGLKTRGFVTKHVLDINEASPVEIREQPSNFVKHSAINTNKLKEEQRRIWCQNAAMQAVSKDVIKFLEDTNTDVMKYYLVEMESENNTSAPSLVLVYVEAFRCPTEPTIYLHVEEVEDGAIVWIIIEGSNNRFPDVEFNSYDLKIVQDITRAPKHELYNTASSSSGVRWTLDANKFTEKYRRQLCEASLKRVLSEGKAARFIKDKPTEASFYYNVTEKVYRNIASKRTVLAFGCPTLPPLFLEVRNTDYQAYAITIFVKSLDIVENYYDETYYIVKFVDEIAEVEAHESIELSASEFEVVDTDKIEERNRFKMCEDALKEKSLQNRDIEFVQNGSIGGKKRYSLKRQSNDQEDWCRIVQAFKCPSKPSVYLQVHRWESEVYIVWVILEKNEPREMTEPVSEAWHKFRLPRDIVDASKFKIKYVRAINEAFTSEISLMPFSPRAKTMVNTDKRYQENERIQMCENAASTLLKENIPLLNDRMTGSSKFFVLQEGFVDERVSEFKLVRAFQCPMERPLYLEVRHVDYRTTVTIIVTEEKPSSIYFKMKYVDSVTPAKNKEVSQEPSPVRTGEFTAVKLLQICKKAAKVIPDMGIDFLNSGSIDTDSDYIVQHFSGQSKTMRIFKCPTRRVIYLEIVPGIPGEYTAWIIITSPRSPFLSSPPVRNVSAKEVDIKYMVKYVTSIDAATSQQIHEMYAREPDLTNPDSSFTQEERLQLCKGAMNLFPVGTFEFKEVGRRLISKTYVLNANSKSPELARAFKCTSSVAPEMYIQVKEYEPITKRYTLWIIVKEDELPPSKDDEPPLVKWDESPPADAMSIFQDVDVTNNELGLIDVDVRGPSLMDVDDFGQIDCDQYMQEQILDSIDSLRVHEFLIVEGMRQIGIEEAVWERESTFLPSNLVQHSLSEGEKITLCENGLRLIPGREAIFMTGNKPKDVVLYAKTELHIIGEEFIWAFECPTDPSTYIQLYADAKSEKMLRRVIIKEHDILPLLYDI